MSGKRTGNPNGCPPRYKSVTEIEKLIEDYFESCKGKVLYNKDGTPALDKYGEPVYYDKMPPTVTGLALALGFTTRIALLSYQGKPEFANTILRAKSTCEQYAEARLFDREGARGSEFSLRCNFRWKNDEQEAQGIEAVQIIDDL